MTADVGDGTVNIYWAFIKCPAMGQCFPWMTLLAP